MFLRTIRRRKDGKAHEYWNIVENRPRHAGRVVQRQLLYLGAINAGQRDAWRRSIEIEDGGTRRQVALLAAERPSASKVDAIGVRLNGLQLQRPRQWGACWLAQQRRQQLDLDAFRRSRLRPSREGTPWMKVLKSLVCCRLIGLGSEWRLHRQWFDASAMADLLESDFAPAAKDTLYRCQDRLIEHMYELFEFLVGRWGELFAARFDVLLYDLTSTYFQTDELRGSDGLRQLGYGRDKRGDCRQVVTALIVTPEGFPLSCEVVSGNTVDCAPRCRAPCSASSGVTGAPTASGCWAAASPPRRAWRRCTSWAPATSWACRRDGSHAWSSPSSSSLGAWCARVCASSALASSRTCTCWPRFGWFFSWLGS